MEAAIFSDAVRDAEWTGHGPLATGQTGSRSSMTLDLREANWTEASMASASISPTSRTSTMDTEAEGSTSLSSAANVINSTSSTCLDSWGHGLAALDEENDEEHWEQNSDDALTVPKLEPEDEDFSIAEVEAAPGDSVVATDETGGLAPVQQKRSRGRPRKHPLVPAGMATKITKGRSKTGCITCRKRKKKCDEAKPRCMNCEKNAVVCEGYHEKQVWKSGRERAEEQRVRRGSLPIITLQPIFHGVETAEDKVFWKHYVNHFSNVLTIESEARNAFKDIMLQLAMQDQGLMHSILSVSSRHIDFENPYGSAILQENPALTRHTLEERSAYHHDAAMTRLFEAADKSNAEETEDKKSLTVHYGQMICLLLQTKAEGNPRGEHRLHLQAYQNLVRTSLPTDDAFHVFMTEFFQYHVYADDLLWHPDTQTTRLASDHWQPAMPIEPPRLIGVADGLFHCLSQITSIRNSIRANMASGAEPLVDYSSLYRAAEIDTAIREWTPEYEAGDSRQRVGLLYKQMMWVYLFRTIYPPSSPMAGRSTLATIPAISDDHHFPGMPVRRASMIASTGSSTTFRPNPGPRASSSQSYPSPRHPSRTTSMHEMDTNSVASYPSFGGGSGAQPYRRPAQHDRRITVAVEEALTILESFSPLESVQTVLLIPCLLIGTACFDVSQQTRVHDAIKCIRGYNGMRSCDRVLDLLRKVWQLMEEGDWLSVWDWQGVARSIGLDFLCA